MSGDRNALTAGLFIVLSFVAAVAVVLMIRKEGAGPSQYRTVTFKLSDDVGGLSPGDEVRAGGVKIGTVRNIEFKELESAAPAVLVTFSVPSHYVFHDDAHIAIQMPLTGSPNLNIISFGVGNQLPDGVALVGSPDAKVAFLNSISEAAPHAVAIVKKFEANTLPRIDETVLTFKQSAESANTLVRHVDAKIDPAIEKYEGIAVKAGDVLTNVRDVLGDTKTDIRGSLKNLNYGLQTVRDKLPALMEDFQKTIANARDLSAGARSVLVENRSRVDAIVKSLKTTSDNLKETSVEVRHSPWRLLYKPTPDEMANLNIYDSARQFSEGAGSLTDAAQALNDAMKDPTADKAVIQKLLEHLDDSFKKFHEAEDKLWSAVKE